MSIETFGLPQAEGEHEGRVAELRAGMAALGLDAVAVASPEVLYYLTGLDHLGYFAFTLLIVPVMGEPLVITREMERPTIRAQLPHCRHLTYGDGTEPAVVVSAALSGYASIGIEDRAMFFPPAVSAQVRTTLPVVRWRDASPLLTQAMAIKSDTEIDRVRRAAALSDSAMAAGIAAAGAGVPDYVVAAEIHHAMFARGGQQPGFVPLIRPLELLDQEHVSWGDRVLRPGSGWFIELSGCFRRYHAPLSRIVYVGEPPPEAADAHAAALAGLHAALAALRPGASTGDVYATWQRAVAGADNPVWPLRHHCGYLVGIGFPPSWVGGGEVLGIRPGGDTIIAPGMTFHLMSWVSGHVVSDTALVTVHGAELLTTTPRDLLVVS